MAGRFLITAHALDRLAERRLEFDQLEPNGSRPVLHRSEGIAGSDAMPPSGAKLRSLRQHRGSVSCGIPGGL